MFTQFPETMWRYEQAIPSRSWWLIKIAEPFHDDSQAASRPRQQLLLHSCPLPSWFFVAFQLRGLYGITGYIKRHSLINSSFFLILCLRFRFYYRPRTWGCGTKIIFLFFCLPTTDTILKEYEHLHMLFNIMCKAWTPLIRVKSRRKVQFSSDEKLTCISGVRGINSLTSFSTFPDKSFGWRCQVLWRGTLSTEIFRYEVSRAETHYVLRQLQHYNWFSLNEINANTNMNTENEIEHKYWINNIPLQLCLHHWCCQAATSQSIHCVMRST